MRDGEFRDRYLIYDRKSTDEADNQKNSLAYQREENFKFAERSNLEIARISLSGFCADGVIAERHSGFKEDNSIAVNGAGMVQYSIARPKFKRLIQALSRGYFKGVICLSWDRISRNKADDAIIAKLMRAGIDIQFAYAQYDNTSAGALHMDIDGMFAAHHSRVTSEKVRLAQFNLREQGVCTHKAPIGYLNVGKSNDKPFDPERAPIIRQMFKLYAKGNVSISDMMRWAREEGLTTPPMRKPRTREQMLSEEDDIALAPKVTFPVSRGVIQRILRNPFYIGRVPGNHGSYVPSVSHKPLISELVFYQVQAILDGKSPNISHDKKSEMPYRGMIRCGECRRLFSPYRTKGKLYLMVHCADGCANKVRNHRVFAVEDQIGEAVARLIPSDRDLAELDIRTRNELTELEKNQQASKQQNERRTRKLREDLVYLQDNKLTLLKNGVYDAAGLVAEEARLNNELNDLQEVKKEPGQLEPDFMQELTELSELLKDAYSRYISVDSFKKAEFARIVFSELSLSGNTLNVCAQNGFKAFENRFDSEGGASGRLSELSHPLRLKKSVVALEKWLEKV